MGLVLFYFPGCPYCRKVLDTIDALEIEVELKDILKNSAFHSELVKLSGDDQVPCLVVDGRPMLESDDIVRFLKSNCS